MKRALSLLLLMLAAAADCGRGEAGQVQEPQHVQGRVDTTLPAELQAKQRAVRRLLNGLQEGVGDAAGLAIYSPGIVYREKFEDFFNGAGQLARWEFNGRPQGNEVPVVLYFDDQNSGLVNPENVRREERVYLVSGSGQQYTISRK